MGLQTPHPPSQHPARREGLEEGHQADPYRLNRKFAEPLPVPIARPVTTRVIGAGKRQRPGPSSTAVPPAPAFATGSRREN